MFCQLNDRERSTTNDNILSKNYTITRLSNRIEFLKNENCMLHNKILETKTVLRDGNDIVGLSKQGGKQVNNCIELLY